MSAKKRISKMVDSSLRKAPSTAFYLQSHSLCAGRKIRKLAVHCVKVSKFQLLKRGGIPFEYQNRVLLMTKMDHLIQNNDKGLTLETSAFKLSTLVNLVLSTQLMMLNHPVIPSHRRSTTVSLETYHLYSLE